MRALAGGTAAAPRTAARAEERGRARGLALGLVLVLPLLAAYEAALAAAGPAGPRNAAEALLAAPLEPLPGPVALARRVVLAALLALALARVRLPLARLGAATLRTVLEGAAFACLLGPLLVLVLPALGAAVPAAAAPAAPLDLARGARLLGAGAYEELVFRVGVYSLVWLAAERTTRFLGGAERPARVAAEAAALLVSSLAFAAFHLDLGARLLGPGGEPFAAAVFAWRAVAGAALALVYRWRGFGVAAWTHGLFNLVLALGSGPGVLVG